MTASRTRRRWRVERRGVAGAVLISVRVPIIDTAPRAVKPEPAALLSSARLSNFTPSTSRDFPLGVAGFTYQDLHRDHRLADLDRAFLDELVRENAPLAARLKAYRADPASLDPLSRSRLLVEAARPLSAFVVRLFGIEAEWRAQAASAGPEAVLFRFRRDFLLRRAVKTKLPEDLAGDGPRSAASRRLRPGDRPPPGAAVEDRPRARHFADGRRAARSRSGLHRRAAPEEEARGLAGRPRRRPRARPAGGVDAGGAPRRERSRRGPARLSREAPRAVRPLVPPAPRAPGPHARNPRLDLVQAARDARLPEPRRNRAPEPRHSGGARGPRARAPAARGLHADGSADDAPRGARRDPLLPALPRAREGLLRQGLLRRQDGGLAEEPPRHLAQGLPAGREDLRDARAAARGRLHRGARARLHRQPDVPRHGPPDLQRLHEGLHLPEAGAGQHPADRDGRPDRRAGAALGRRDLRPPDALEPAAPAPPAPGALHGPQGPHRRPGPGRVHAGALPVERGLRRGGRGRPEDRAAAGGLDRRRRRRDPADPRLRRAREAARPAAARGFRRRVRVRHHRALGQELPDAHPSHARAPAPLRDSRRRPLRRRALGRAGLRRRLRPRRDRRGRRPADDHSDQEQHHPGRAQGLRLPDGPAADRRIQGGGPRQPPGASCRPSSSAAA